MRSALLSALVLFPLFGCSKPPQLPAAVPAAREVQPAGPTKAQPKLATVKLWIGQKELETEVAQTFDEVQTGMMFRKSMGENEAMLFVFQRPIRSSFWMRNTLLPLSCAYIDVDGKILELHDMKPLDETAILANSDQVQFVLEVNQGWFQRNGITPGFLVKADGLSLQQRFLHGR